MALGFAVVAMLAGCGKNFYFAGRKLPPSGLANRVMILVQHPGPTGNGVLTMVDAFYDIRHSFDNKIASFPISSYSGAEPISIQNLPEQQIGAVYSIGDGGFRLINYQTEKAELGASQVTYVGASSIFITQDLQYTFAANQAGHALVVSQAGGGTYALSLPGVFRVSVNPGGSVVLAFVQNSDLVYSVVRLQANQAPPPGSLDCEPQNLPTWCLVPVTPLDQSGNPVHFDRPAKAIFSADGTRVYVLNCGPECGGSQAGVTTFPIAPYIINSGVAIPPGPVPPAVTLPVPGGATNARLDGTTLYLAGQQLQPDGLFAGVLSVMDTAAQKITATYSISDGTPGKMIFSDDNTLWIGSVRCIEGERYKNSQANPAANIPFGCLTSFNTATKKVFIDSYKGDLTGIAAVTGLHKIYVAEGGQVHIYNTADGSERDNTFVTVTGTAYDVAYMDAPTNADNALY